MTTTATQTAHDTTPEPVLFLAFALREKTWTLGFTVGHGQKPRERRIAARHQARCSKKSPRPKAALVSPTRRRWCSCDEAGREGFWRPRFLQAPGISNPVGDSSSIAVNRRQRRAKSEALDGRQLLRMLMRYDYGAGQRWRVVQGSLVEAEEPRHLHRTLETLKQERATGRPPVSRACAVAKGYGLRA